MMNRATLIYVVMIAVFGAGLVAILRLGRGLSVPPDLAGKWQCEPDEKVMQIDQSGRFVVIDLDGTRRSMRITQQEKQPDGRMRLKLDGHGESLQVTGAPHGDDAEFLLSTGSLQVNW